MRGSVLQTPLKDQNSANRRPKSNLDPNRNVRKVLKKNLDHEFKSVVEKNVTDLESSEVISGDNTCDESAENIVSLTCSLETPASETVAVSDLSSPSSTMTEEAFGDMNNKYVGPGINSFKTIDSSEAEMFITILREARVRLLKSKGLGHSKSLLDALVSVMIDEFSDGKYEEKGWLNRLLSSNSNLVFLAFMIWSLALSVLVFFLSLESNGLPSGPTPT